MPLEVIERRPPTASDKPTLLFVHGAWHGAWCWQPHFMPYFAARGYPTVAFSLRGHGTSSGTERLPVTRIADYLDDLRVMLARCPTPPVLIGHSMGGFLIQHLLQTRPDIPAAVLLAPIPPFGTSGIAWRTLRYRPRVAVHVLLTGDVYRLVAEPTPDGTRFFSPAMPPAQAERYMRRFTAESWLAVGLDALALALPRTNGVQTPLLVCGGAHDILFTPGEIQRTAQRYGTQAVIFDDMGHELMLDPGWPHVATHILNWLTKQGL